MGRGLLGSLPFPPMLAPMRAWTWAILAMAAAVACGGEEPLGLDGGVGVDANVDGGRVPETPACAACTRQLDVDTAQCTNTFNGCSNAPNQETPYYVRCFAVDAVCYETSLDRAGACHDACGDQAQGNVERCAGDCFLNRGECHGTNLLRADACFENCSGASCVTCRSEGIAAADGCDAVAQDCANQCVRIHRGG